MVAHDNKSKKPAAIAPADAEDLPDNRARMERELLQTRDALEHKIAELSKSEALHRSAGNQTQAARLLGLSRFGLQKKLRRYEID